MPPEAPLVTQPGEQLSAALSCRLTVLRQRADFLKAASARRAPAPSMLVQARRRAEDDPATGIRVGFTCSKKVGNAVIRNRAKRRLRALAAELVPILGRQGWDYVLIGKLEVTVSRRFDDLRDDLRRALLRVHS